MRDDAKATPRQTATASFGKASCPFSPDESFTAGVV